MRRLLGTLSGRTGLWVAVALVVVGAGLVLLAGTRPLLSIPAGVTVERAPRLGGPAVVPVALAVLSAGAILVVVRGPARVLLGMFVVVVTAAAALGDGGGWTAYAPGSAALAPRPSTPWWRGVLVVGYAATVLGGLLAVGFGRLWPPPSARYARGTPEV
ncbi:MAG: hypothetical protein M3Q27_05240, partial [Actinomycetota bacterium]|nr:hypothetical protein [Actinomycetota bacterium]